MSSANINTGLDLETLRRRCDEGEEFEYLLFWGHSVPKGGKVGKTCLSQWYPSPFTIDGVLYRTAEHYMMANKARLFGDDDKLAEILAAEKPPQAKKLGRLVARFDPYVWAQNCRRIVTEASQHKFAQNADMKQFLLSTGEAVIVEASPRDKVWGIGLAASSPLALDPHTWDGQNLLGFSLMDARNNLREL